MSPQSHHRVLPSMPIPLFIADGDYASMTAFTSAIAGNVGCVSVLSEYTNRPTMIPSGTQSTLSNVTPSRG